MVDVQPPYFNGRLRRADIVIDHHQGYAPNNAAFQDVRPGYGATATIMTEYLVAADERISERLATALLYGIRSDTLMLKRRVTDSDIQAFTQLYPHANYSLLRQIDRPELPARFARVLARVMRRFEVHDGIALLHLGRVERDDLIVQMADFCLQFEGVEWVVVSGKLDDNLVIAVRNHGIGRRQRGRGGAQAVWRNRQRRRPSQHVQGGDRAERLASARAYAARRSDRSPPARTVRSANRRRERRPRLSSATAARQLFASIRAWLVYRRCASVYRGGDERAGGDS